MRVAGVTISGAFSGADREIFAELTARKHLMGVVTHEIPALWNAFFLVTSIHVNRRKWFSEWRRKVMKSPRAFVLRTAAVAQQLRDRDREFDVILQVSDTKHFQTAKDILTRAISGLCPILCAPFA